MNHFSIQIYKAADLIYEIFGVIHDHGPQVLRVPYDGAPIQHFFFEFAESIVVFMRHLFQSDPEDDRKFRR